MPCPECGQNYQRALRAETAEQSLLLFTETFSRLSRQLWQIEQEADRKRYGENPPPPGAAPIKRARYLLVPVDLLGGEPATDEGAELKKASAD